MEFDTTKLPARFWAKVDRGGPDRACSQTGENIGPCWLWTGAITPVDRGGYGIWGAKIDGRFLTQSAHRAAYIALVGPVPIGLQLDHLCRTRRCVNPAHLEPVTPKENIRRGATRARWAAITHCPQGHAYTAENTDVQPRQGYPCRMCRTCRRLATRRRYYARTGRAAPAIARGYRQGAG